MHSKWQIWDFFSSVPQGHMKAFEGVMALNTFDPLCLKIVKDHLTSGLIPNYLHTKMPSEVTFDWIEEEFYTLSLFGDQESFFIHQAHDLSPEIIDSLSNLQLSGRFIIMSFENELAGWKKILKEGKCSTLMVDPPRFWESIKLVDFISNYLKLPLSYMAKNWIIENIENNFSDFFNACTLLKLNFSESREISLDQIKEVLVVEKMDQFLMANLFCRLKMKEFYERLVGFGDDFEKMRTLFSFMQSHLIKLADTSYLSKKPRLTQYDKDLQNSSKLWKQEKIFEAINHFNRWEILCKRKDSHLWNEIKSISITF
jgi:DNA polymerase III delta subunit